MVKIHLQQKKLSRILMSCLILTVILLTACAPENTTPTPSETASVTPTTEETAIPTQTATPRPTTTPTLPPLGSSGNPLALSFILTPEEIPAITAANEIALLLEEATGYAIEILIYPDFQSLSTAITNGEVDLFWLMPFEYIYLNWENSAEVFLISNHLGVNTYGVQFIANVNRGFTSYFDVEANQSFGDPLEALQQFSGTRPCFLNQESLPGYYVPIGLLANTSTPTLEPVFTYSYNAMIRALYIQGICDFGVTYALIGDPFSTGDISQNLPDAMDEVMIVWRSQGIIPNRNLSASPNLPVFIRFRLQEAFLDIADNPEQLTLLSTALGYDVVGLHAIQDSFYNPLRAAIFPLELDLESITQPSSNE